MIAGHGRGFIALSHHHPADIFEHLAAVLPAAGRAHEHDAGLAAGILLETDHLGHRVEGIAGIDRREHPEGGVAEIGDGVERDIRHGLAEHDVKDEEVVHGRTRIADRPREHVRRLHREAGAEQAIVERHVAHGDGARGRMLDDLADAEVFKEIAGARLRHGPHQICGRSSGSSRASGAPALT